MFTHLHPHYSFTITINTKYSITTSMSKLQVDVPDDIFDRFRRKHYRSMNKRITELIEQDLGE